MLKVAHFVRPVVFFGAIADAARRRLLQTCPARFGTLSNDDNNDRASGIVRLSAIRRLIAGRQHCLLDVTPQAVDRLNFAQMYPIVIMLRCSSKQLAKEVRVRYEANNAATRVSTRKLVAIECKVEKHFGFLLSATLQVQDVEQWLQPLVDLVARQQSMPLWMSERPVRFDRELVVSIRYAF